MKVYVKGHDVTRLCRNDDFKLSSEAVDIIINKLQNLHACSGIGGFDQIATHPGGFKLANIWFAISCEKVGAFAVCTNCRKLHGNLCRKLSNLKTKPNATVKKTLRASSTYFTRRAKQLAINQRRLRCELVALKRNLKKLSLDELEGKLQLHEMPRSMISNVVHCIKTAKVKAASGMR